MPNRDKLTLGEIAGMRDQLRLARRALGLPPKSQALGEAQRYRDAITRLAPRDRALLDVVDILDRLLE